MQFTDSHCHLDFPEFSQNITEILQHCQAKNIHRIIVPAVNPEHWQRVLSLSKPNKMVDIACALGIHPWYIILQDKRLSQAYDVNFQEQQLKRAIIKEGNKIVAIGECGIDVFKAEVEKRAGVSFAPSRPYEFTHRGDRIGWVEGIDGKHHLTLFIQSGRILDYPNKPLKTGCRKIAEIHQGDFRMTANQNLIIAGVPADQKAIIEKIAREHGLIDDKDTEQRKNSMACVSLPTCPLAMAEAERYLEDFVAKVQGLLDEVELGDQDIVTRITGCPNGCARPFLAEIGLVGKAPGRYNLFLGADGRGLRVNKLYRENLTETEILAELKPVLSRYRAERNADERFGDFVVRIGVVKEVKDAQVDFHA